MTVTGRTPFARTALLTLAFCLAFGPPARAQQLTSPGLALGVSADRTTYLATDPIQITIALTNISGAPIITSKSLTEEPLHLLLTFIGPDGQPIVATEFGTHTQEGGPPPTLLIGTEYVQSDPVVVVAAGSATTVTLPNARLFYALTQPGRYTLKAAAPVRVYPSVLRTTEDGTTYAKLDTAVFGGAIRSNTVAFSLVVDADGDGYAYPDPDARLSAYSVADCNDQNPLVNPGRAEIPNDGLDNDCNPATPDDALPPVTTAGLTPLPNAAGWNNTAVTLTLTATDASGISSLAYTLTGAVTGALTVPTATTTIPLAAQGLTTVAFQATDRQGQQETPPNTVVVKLDRTAPSLTVPASLTVNATSSSGASVLYATTTTDNLDTSPTTVCAPASGSTFPIGTTTVACTATDQAGNRTSKSFPVNVTTGNTAPVVTVVVTPTGVMENAVVTLAGTITDPNSADTHTVTINWGDGSANTVLNLPAGSLTVGPVTHRYLDDNPSNTASDGVLVQVDVTDSGTPVGTGSTMATVTIQNAVPTIVSLTGPLAPVTMGTTVSVAAVWADAGTQDPHSCRFSWDDGSAATTVAVAAGVTSCAASHPYPNAGVYSISVTISDDDLGAVTGLYDFVVVYDPNGGFVTGGGWIASPAGAYAPNPAVTGKATFGFVSKYLKGATVPSGETEFEFSAGSLHFHSTSYEWLVVSGAKAQYKGTGTIEGDAKSYGFLLTATDGQVSGGGGVDKLRMKIWNKASGGVIYDNAPSASDDLDKSAQQAIGGGNIVIHAK